ncbi:MULTISPECIES: LpxL/LpxP family Kdo(2)-lipid IV(A) lauroyl/palmitoleoyl acyltransferase [Colwellia]|uniref:Lipid A biosynthesis acyltransferase n=1 Tax=Colwellia psychrerythraea (strain 34H / ATCC BAA-681) TaxID=167879 RepID=Q47WI8_COLP3|nr:MULTISPECIES: LpxL/LpxP family Kdo(2)-lipid IV(A) lauroyl/palmitoleoyl acyltransferase [Colwellia]AAZ26125.1 lipid A biosynthesis lauroyl acyltransferase [Colwellia psychrerythraea 34H]PKH85320.1 lipid A biosynthesis lauroyl acyltransferase [Colwellia sp. Bg11-28]
MSSNKVLQPDFKLSFLLPKYWLTWLGVFILYTISWLPFKLQLFMGRMLGRLLMKIGSKRKHVALTNLRLCFPDKSEDELQILLKKNFENTGIALFETGMGWWWPDWRVKRKFKVKGLEHLEKARKEGNGVLLLAMHYLSVEMNARGVGYGHPMVVFYRPHNNQLMEFFQFRGRGRSNKYMLGKRDVKGLMKALRDGEACIYLPDQDYGRNRSVFVPFFGVKEAATTTGTLIFARQKNVETMMIIPVRNDDGSGYTLEIMPPLENFPTQDNIADVTRINQELEKAISRKPEQYMWLHRRFKTRPNPDDASLYK